MLSGLSGDGIRPASGTRPGVGRSAAVPLHCDGKRSEPPRSLPMPSGTMPVASATASPPLEPPGVRPASHGLRVGPASALSVCQRSAKSGMFPRASGIAPAARRCSTAGASTGAIACASAVTPHVVAVPATSMLSLTLNGTPCSVPVGSPAASRRSAAAAADSASSASTTCNALTSGLTASMRSRWAATTSRLDSARSRLASASRPAPSSQISMAATVRTASSRVIGRSPYGSISRCSTANSAAAARVDTPIFA